jgi:prepilin-type N-terminal cleavage/methylation domain-containing protein
VKRQIHGRGGAGFTLVEVSLAMLVIGLGLLTVFGLFPTGLNMNKLSIDETQAAMFSEEVFSGYHAKIDGDPVAWDRLDSANAPGLEAVASGMWIDYGAGVTVRVSNASTPVAPQYPIKYIGFDGKIAFALRYRLVFEPVTAPPVRIKRGRLQCWSGEFGSVRTNEMMEFYTEFYDFRLPR